MRQYLVWQAGATVKIVAPVFHFIPVLFGEYSQINNTAVLTVTRFNIIRYSFL